MPIILVNHCKAHLFAYGSVECSRHARIVQLPVMFSRCARIVHVMHVSTCSHYGLHIQLLLFRMFLLHLCMHMLIHIYIHRATIVSNAQATLQKTLSVALALWVVAHTISIAQYVTDFSQCQTASAKTAQQHHVWIPGKFAQFVMDQWTSRIQYA
jgi:hypothetical protein